MMSPIKLINRKGPKSIFINNGFVLIGALIILILAGCAAPRGKGETYPGYSCRESNIHYASRCNNGEVNPAQMEKEVAACEREMAKKICDRELADLLKCMGQAIPGSYAEGGTCTGAPCLAIRDRYDGCDCSSQMKSVKDCRLVNGY